MAKYKAPESRDSLARKAASARHSLLLFMIFTVVNIIMVMLDTGSYFLFSISVPYYLVMMGKGLDNGFIDGAWDVNGTYTITGLIIAAIILVVYLLCWLLSKKRSGWLTVTLILIILDTVALALLTFALYENPATNLMDFLFHAWMIWDIARGTRSAAKLKKLPAEEELTQEDIYAAIHGLEDSEKHFDM